MGEIGNDVIAEGGSDRAYHDGYRPGCFLGRERCRRPPGDNHIDLERDQLGRQRRITGVVAFGPAIGEPDILSLAPAELAQALSEAVEWLERSRGENADLPHLIALLRACREWPLGHGAEKRNEIPPPHSMTSSARPDNVSGTVSRSVSALLRLMTSPTFTTCWTGKSAGLAPLRILPAKTPAWRIVSARSVP